MYLFYSLYIVISISEIFGSDATECSFGALFSYVFYDFLTAHFSWTSIYWNSLILGWKIHVFQRFFVCICFIMCWEALVPNGNHFIINSQLLPYLLLSYNPYTVLVVVISSQQWFVFSSSHHYVRGRNIFMLFLGAGGGGTSCFFHLSLHCECSLGRRGLFAMGQDLLLDCQLPVKS